MCIYIYINKHIYKVTKQIDLSIYSQSGTKLVACAAYSFIHTSVDGGNTWSTHADVGVRDWTGVR